MTPTVSLHLDGARFLAALAVLFHHLLQPPFYSEAIYVPGHAAVIIFFVISGFVIAYVTDKREGDWRKYTINRMARIYSVALPALAITAALYAAGRAIDAASTPEYDYPVVRLLMAVLFLNQIWNFTVQPLTNGPYWSLCYEVWYYIAFGLWGFASPRWRIPSLALVIILVGPRILLLAPVWLLGVWLYRCISRGQQRSWRGAEWLFLTSTIALISSAFGVNPAHALAETIRDSLVDGRVYMFGYGVFIGGLWRFPEDYVVAILFAATIFFAAKCRCEIDESARIPRAIRLLASYTFSLYLYHVPLMVFIHAVLGPFNHPFIGLLTQIALILAGVFLLGRFTEHRKRPYTLLFDRLLRGFKRNSVR